jgi:hypothetical protein
VINSKGQLSGGLINEAAIVCPIFEISSSYTILILALLTSEELKVNE